MNVADLTELLKCRPIDAEVLIECDWGKVPIGEVKMDADRNLVILP